MAICFAWDLGFHGRCRAYDKGGHPYGSHMACSSGSGRFGNPCLLQNAPQIWGLQVEGLSERINPPHLIKLRTEARREHVQVLSCIAAVALLTFEKAKAGTVPAFCWYNLCRAKF